MDGVYEYITNPSTMISFVVFVFGLGATWSNLNGRMRDIEKRIDKLEELDLDSRLTEIQTNLKRVMERLSEISLSHKK